VIAAILRTWPARTPSQSLPAAGGALVVALSAPIGVWTVGGLEQPLVAACLAWATALSFALLSDDGSRGALLGSSLCLGLLCLARPDGPLFTAGTVLALALGAGAPRKRLRTALALGSFPVLCVLGQQVFRVASYGEWIPNPALVKLAPSEHHLRDGLRYVGAGLLSLSPFSQLGLAIAVAGTLGIGAPDPARRARLRLLLVQALLWMVYVAAVGGDIFPAYRHFVPIVVLQGFAVAEGLAWLAPRAASRRAALALAATLATMLAAFALLQLRSHQSQRAIAERFEWRGQVVGLAFARAFGGARPLVAVTAAGCIPYWSGLPALDMLGLNDRHIARRRPPDFGAGPLAHELGDGAYVLSQRPDLIVHHVGSLGGELRSSRELAAMPEYHEAYAPVSLVATEPFEHRFIVWVRRESEKVGIRRAPDRVAIPGHLLAARGVGVARLDRSNRFEALVDRRNRGLVERVELPAGTWRLEVEATGPVLARLQTSRSGRVIAEGELPLAFSVHERDGLTLDLLLRAPPMTQARIGEARFVRLVE
jgi:arabinofuranosyltransferase